MDLVILLLLIIAPMIYLGKKHGLIALMLFSIPQETYIIDVGISLKFSLLFLLVMYVKILLNGKELYKYFSIITNDIRYLLLFCLILLLLFSTLINNPESFQLGKIASFILLLSLVPLFNYYVSVHGVAYIVNTIGIATLLYSIITIGLYLAIINYPDMVNYSSVFNVASFDLRETLGLMPHLHGFTKGAAVHAYFLLPGFVFFLLNAIQKRTMINYFKLVVVLFAVLFTFNRTAIGALLFMSFSAVLIYRYKTYRKIILTVILLILVFAFSYEYLLTAFFEFSEFKGNLATRENALDLDHLTANRFSYWLLGIELFKESPIFGIGIGKFLESSRFLFAGPKDLHSTYLMTLVELGLPFTILYFFIFLYTATRLFRITIKVNYNEELFIPHIIVFTSILGTLIVFLFQMMFFNYMTYILLGIALGLTKGIRYESLGRQIEHL